MNSGQLSDKPSVNKMGIAVLNTCDSSWGSGTYILSTKPNGQYYCIVFVKHEHDFLLVFKCLLF